MDTSTMTGRQWHHRRTTTSLAVIAALALAPVAALAHPSQAGASPSGPQVVGAVYVATNAWTGNKIVTFPRLADGRLQAPDAGVPTGGLGSGPGAIPGVATDPLGSQGSVVVDPKQMRLFAVNAGSGNVSMFKIKPSGLTLLDTTTATSGTYPVSLAVKGDQVYVLNAETNSVTRFEVSSRRLALRQSCTLPPAPRQLDAPYAATADHSEQPVATEAPGQLGLSPDGKHLVVIAKEGPLLTPDFPVGETAGNGEIHVFSTASDGTLTNCSSPTSYALPENATKHGRFPFSFAWTGGGQLLVTEVFGSGTDLTASAVQPFELGRDGSLTPISDPVPSNQIAVCWISVSGRNVYTTNYLTNDVTGYTVDKTGRLTLQDPNADHAPASVLQTPIDQALSADGDDLYQLSPGNGTVVPFAIDAATGHLTMLAAVPDGIGAGAGQQGIATVDFP